MAEPSRLVRWARGSSVAFEFCTTIAAGGLLGVWLDNRWGTTPWLAMGGTVIGSVGGFVRLLQMLRRFENLDQDRERDD